MKNRKLQQAGAGILAAILLLGGSLAYFTDSVTTQANGTAGTVALSLDSEINLLNPEGKDIINPGDQRDAGFTVTNEGNKSIDVRTTIALTTQSNAGFDLAFSGDAATQSEYDLYLRSDVEYVEGYGYMPKEGTQPLQIKSIDKDVITYALPEYVLNGNSNKYDEVETVDGVTDFSKFLDYVLVMKGEAGNEWQNSAISIDVLVEAKQHENTGSGWQIVAQESTEIGSINKDVVKGENIITDDISMRIVYTGGSTVVNPPLKAAEDQYGEALEMVKVVSDSSLYDTLLASGEYTDVSRDQNMDVIAGVVANGSTSTVSAVDTGVPVFYLVAEDNTIIMAPEEVVGLFANLRRIKTIIMEDMYFNNTANMSGMFQNSSSLETVVFPSTNKAPVVVSGGTTVRVEYDNVTNIENIFKGCGNLEDADLKDFSNIQSASGAFTGCENLKEVDLSSLDWIDITWLKWLWENANSLDKIIISAQAEQALKKESTSEELESLQGVVEVNGELPPVEKVEGTYTQLMSGLDLNAIFHELYTSTPYTKIRFVNDTDIYNQVMATSNYRDVSLDGVSAFIGVVGDTCYVATMDDKITYAPVDSSQMFRALSGVTVIDVRALDTSDVTNMSLMFYNCSKITQLDLSSFDTSRVSNTGSMFQGCSSLTTIYVSGLWNISDVGSYMFQGCTRLVGQSGTVFNGSYMGSAMANYQTGYLTFYNGKANTLVAGPNFKALLPSTTTEVYIGDYHNMIPTEGYIDLSVAQNESVVGFLDGNKFYVTSKNGGTINTCGSMYKMFEDKTKVTTIVFDNIDTSSVFNMQYMFSGSGITNLDIDCINTTRVTSMAYMFQGCSSLQKIDISHFDTSSVTDMNNMFRACSNVTSINVNGIDTRAVTNMSLMFYNCSKITQLDLSSFDTSRVSNTGSMFQGCSSLTTIYVSGLWNIPANVGSYMFQGCARLVGQSGTVFNGSYISGTMANYQTGYLTYYDGAENVLVAGPNFKTLLPSTATEVYIGDYSTNIPVSGLIDMSISGDGSIVGWLDGTKYYVTSVDGGTINTCGSMYKMFENKNAITTIEFNNINTSATSNMSYMFSGCSVLEVLDIDCFDTSAVTNMAYMFSDCPKLSEIDVSHFDTSSVTDMSYMFNNCQNAAEINVGHFNTSDVTNMSLMFQNCSKITQLDLSSFDTSSQPNTGSMFQGCSLLNTIYVSDMWNITTGGSYMFRACTRLVGQSGTVFNGSYISGTMANYQTGYLTYKEYIPA